MKDSQLAVRGGRELAYTEIGNPDGDCLFFFHGAPLSRLYLVDLEREFAARGLRVISPDRPGYGRSSPQPGRSMAEWPADVAALADALGIGRFLVAGHSSGGPYAVACAALMGDRVRGGVLIAGVTDMAWIPAWDGYFEPEIPLMRAPDEDTVRRMCVESFGEDGTRFLSADLTMSQPDADLMRDPAFEKSFTAAFSEAFRQGVIGYAQDIYLQGRPWPFDPSRVVARIDVVHGDQDTILPLSHSRHSAELIPGSRLRVLPGHGHLTLSMDLPAIASELVRALR